MGINKLDKDELGKLLDSGKLVLIDMSASWCGPCQMMAPIMDEIVKDYEDREIEIVNVDIDELPEAAAKFSVMSVPTFLFLKDGKVVESVVGATAKDILAQKIDNLLKKDKK